MTSLKEKEQFNSKQANLFTNKGWQILVVLLNNPKQEWTLRNLAKKSRVSLGWATEYKKRLGEKKFCLPNKNKLVNQSQLLNEARYQYNFDNNIIKSYYSELPAQKLIKKIINIGKAKKSFYAFTRMAGASLVAPYVRFQTVDFYVESQEDILTWFKELNLQETEFSGNVNIIIPQGEFVLLELQKKNNAQIVNNIQLYLDLYKYPARGREQAEYLREKIIKIW